MDRPEKRLRNPADDLTDDLVVEILSRLPVKSVCRAKCVSWHWRGLIAHPLHRTRLPQTLSGFFCCDEITASHGDGTTSSPYIVTDDEPDDDGGGHGTASSPYLIWDTDDEDDDDYVDIVTKISTPDFVSILPVEEEQSPVVPDPSLSFLSGAGYKSIFPKHGCDGHLLCLCWNVSPPTTSEPDYVVCNPATQQWRTIPRTHRRTKSDLPVPLFLCLDDDDPASAAHFHVFALIENRDMYITGVDIYSSETGVWSHHDNGWDDDGIMTLQPSVFLDGMLHLIAHARSRIVAVDRDGETWRTIPLLEGMDTAAYFCLTPETAFIGKSQGRLHYMNNMPDDYFMLSVWMLEDYRRGRWVLRFRYNMNNPEVFGSRVPKAQEAYNCAAIHPEYCNLIFLNVACSRRYC